MWAIGTIMAELFNLEPIFPGTSEIDEIFRICNICGTPTTDSNNPNESINLVSIKDTYTPHAINRKYYDAVTISSRPSRDGLYGGGIWQDGLKLAASMNFKFPSALPVPLSQVIKGAPDDALQLIADMLKYDPHRRPTALDAIKHPWFSEYGSRVDSPDVNHQVIDDITSELYGVKKETLLKKNIQPDYHAKVEDSENITANITKGGHFNLFTEDKKEFKNENILDRHHGPSESDRSFTAKPYSVLPKKKESQSSFSGISKLTGSSISFESNSGVRINFLLNSYL